MGIKPSEMQLTWNDKHTNGKIMSQPRNFLRYDLEQKI